MTEMLHHWVAAEANRRPDATAVVLGEERLSYGELEVLSNQLALAAFPHTIFACFMVSAGLVITVAAWHLARGQVASHFA